ncbi:hypothetical protein V8F06_005322 [Rhypophila decipiens]
MDFLFIGALPSSAMAEVEIQREALRTSSLQQMLDLERKYKMDRLHSPTSPPASPPPPPDSPASGLGLHLPPLQLRRADSLSRQQNLLMLKATRRSTAPPPLSITIPEPPASGRDGDLAGRGQSSDAGQEDDCETETETTAEPLHKQVKFLAPDDEDEGDMSDQSSICQSPSWEGYGQRKKEKKKEAERRKKEKEQAEKEAKAEAKAAKKKAASRLSKTPRPATLTRNSSMVAMPNPERSMSDPHLAALHSSVESRLTHGPQFTERASSTNDLQHLRSQRRTETDNVDLGANTKTFLGGLKLDKEKESMMQNSQPSVYPPSLPYQLIQTSGPEPTRVGSLSPTFPAVRQETRSSPRENAFPPSASRTPMLRHMPVSGHSRSNSLLQGATKFLRGQDGKSSGDAEDRSEDVAQVARETERGRDRAQSGQQRSQSSSRTAGGEASHASASTHSSSTRSSSRNTQHTRRSSITHDAKNMAMKLTGKRLTPSAKDEQNAKDPSQTDYFNFMERSYSTSVLSSLAAGGAPSARPATRKALGQNDKDGNSARETKHEPTPMSRQSSSKEGSIAASATGSQGKKGRSLKDAAKAALHIGTPTNNSKSNVSVPPYLAFRTRMLSQSSSSGDKKSAPVPGPIPSQEYSQIARENSSGQPSSSNSVKTSDLETQAGSRASEGSSSTSSAYEDGSPLPSPNTTPDTSRPQSSKGMPLHGGDTTEAKESSIQDDEMTLRQSSDSSASSNSSTTPRLEDSTELKSEMADEERWSRTALPLEIDGDADAQSFTTSFSHQDEAQEKPEWTTMGRKDASQSHSEILNALRMAMSQPKLARSLSDPALRPSESDSITQKMLLPPIEKPISIPAKSKRRKQSITSPVAVQGENLSRGEDVSPSSGDSQREEAATARMANLEDPTEKAVRRSRESDQRTHPEHDFSRSEEATMKESKRERHGARRRHRERDMSTHDEVEHTKEHDTEEARITNFSKPSTRSPRTASFPQSHFQEEFQPAGHQESIKAKSSHAGSRVSTPEPPNSPPKPSALPRVASAPAPSTNSSKVLPVAPLGPSASRPAGPVSILKQPTRSMSDSVQETAGGPSSSSRSQPHILSALPKHMQLQTGGSARPSGHGPESRMAPPIAKMFVECCNCKFYHDMPSKLYECMARPDAVIEDRNLGISGAITTMVKCPWCQHNMSTSCCAGYAAVVYLKEKLH